MQTYTHHTGTSACILHMQKTSCDVTLGWDTCEYRNPAQAEVSRSPRPWTPPSRGLRASPRMLEGHGAPLPARTQINMIAMRQLRYMTWRLLRSRHLDPAFTSTRTGPTVTYASCMQGCKGAD